MNYFTKVIALVITISLLLIGCAAPGSTSIEPREIEHTTTTTTSNERTFSMGFTRWPSEISLKGVKQADDFIAKHADLVSIMFIGGIPWQEALENKPFSKDIQNNLNYQVPNGYELLLSISPLDMGRAKLAPYWGEKDNLPLPKIWQSKKFNSFEVTSAFSNFVLRSIDKLKPDYLAIGIESNALLTHSPTVWNDYKDFHQQVYRIIKKQHPDIPVFFTIEYNHYTGYTGAAKGTPQKNEVASLMQYSDMVAISSYPHMSYETPWPIRNDHFDFAKQFNKPIGIAETGMSSKKVKTFGLKLRGSEKDQHQYYKVLLETAHRDKYKFIATFATTDFDKLVSQLPNKEIREIAKIWQFTGLQNRSGKGKQALKIWDEYLAKTKH